jgi:aspartate aminotransferase
MQLEIFQIKLLNIVIRLEIYLIVRNFAATTKKFNINLTPDEIIVSAGASEAILFAIQTCMDEGDEIIIPEPFYANYNGFATNAGVTVVPIPSSIESGFAFLQFQNLKKLLLQKQKL